VKKEHAIFIALAISAAILIALALWLDLWGRLRERIEGPARGLVASYGLPGTFVVMILAGTALPLASPAIIALCASLMISPTPLALTALALVAALGYTIGLMLNYVLGRLFGMKFVEEHVSQERFERLSTWLDRWGMGLVAAFCLVPMTPMETLSLICGVFKTHPAKFAFVSFVFKAVQFAIFAFIGYELAGLIWD